MLIKETNGTYTLSSDMLTAKDILHTAKSIISENLAYGIAMGNNNIVKDYLTLELGMLQHEEFHIIYLNNKHELICCEMMYKGTIDQCAVYPREVLKRVLELNACAIILAHNHPSGNYTPSRADRHITNKLKECLNYVDVRVLDHIIVASDKTYSFAENGLM